MILNQIINLILLLVGGISSFLPVVTIANIPYFGPQISSVLNTVVTSFNALLITFPYGQVAWHVFIWIIIPFEALMLLAKIFLGNRLPAHLN